MEEWKEISRFYGLYSVSSFARVRNNRNGKILAQCPDTKGYPQLNPCVGGVRKMTKVHILVCEAFHGKRQRGMEVDHIDGDPSNCLPSNLRWVTRTQNNRFRNERHGGQPWNRGEKHGMAKMNALQARIAQSLYDMGARGYAVLAEACGVNRAIVSRAARRITWKSA